MRNLVILSITILIMTAPSGTAAVGPWPTASGGEATGLQSPRQFDVAWDEVQHFFAHYLEEQGMVGGSLWFFQDGEPLARETYGFADLETGRRVDEDTIFHWGSITKTFTGIAIMQLRDRGLLSLDDPVVHYIPELRQVHNPFGDMREITIRHLMSHSAGFRGPTWPWGGDKDWHPHEPTSWDQIVAMLPYTEILFEPGSRWSYSNPGIIFLGRIIELLTGDDYEVYIDKNVFRPLDMRRAYFDLTPYHLLEDRANNYAVVDGRPMANGLDFDTGITVSNGGLNAPITDMARYLAFLVGAPDDATMQARYDGILQRSTLEEMWEVQIEISGPVSPGGTDPADLRQSMGLTYFILETGGLRLIGHTGSQKAYFSFFYIDPAARTAAIAAFNSQGVPGEDGSRRPDARAVVNTVRTKLLEEIFPLFNP
jgi:CubicO group peptidase (beta-lactamase class C family)